MLLKGRQKEKQANGDEYTSLAEVKEELFKV